MIKFTDLMHKEWNDHGFLAFEILSRINDQVQLLLLATPFNKIWKFFQVTDRMPMLMFLTSEGALNANATL